MEIHANGQRTCTREGAGRVPTRSVSSGDWGGRGPIAGWHGSFPPASEREARMDDPMIRSRLGRINGTRPFGALDPKPGPLLIFRLLKPVFPRRASAIKIASNQKKRGLPRHPGTANLVQTNGRGLWRC